MRSPFMLMTAAAFTLSAGLAVAGTPFGADDTGFVPPDKDTAKCEDGVSKEVSKLGAALLKCNIKDSDDQFKNGGTGSFDGVACQVAARGKYDTKTGALTCTGPAACVDRPGLRDLTTTLINLNGGVVFCDSSSGTAQDAPNTGFVPADKETQKCEDAIAKSASKLLGAIVKCHIKAADQALKGKPYNEEACEQIAMGQYDLKTFTILECPSCLGAAAQGALRDLVETLLDGNNVGSYCASPSGAFLN